MVKPQHPQMHLVPAVILAMSVFTARCSGQPLHPSATSTKVSTNAQRAQTIVQASNKLAPMPHLAASKASSVKLAVSPDACDHSPDYGNADNHVCMVRHQHKVAVRKGEVAAKAWKVEQDISAAKYMCMMPHPRNMPSTAERQPVKGDLVRPQNVSFPIVVPKMVPHVMQGGDDQLHNSVAMDVIHEISIDHTKVCLPLRWKKDEDSVKCGWKMKNDDKAEVVETDGKGGKFRLSNPTTHRPSAMTSWANWRYDNTVLVGIMEDVTNLKADCEKAVFSLYSIQTDIRDTTQELEDLPREVGNEMVNSPMTSAQVASRSEHLHKLDLLQGKLDIANERLQQVWTLKKRYDTVMR